MLNVDAALLLTLNVRTELDAVRLNENVTKVLLMIGALFQIFQSHAILCEVQVVIH